MNKACGWHSHLATQCRCLNQVKAEGFISRMHSCLSMLVVFLNDMFSSGRWEQALKNNFFWRQTNWLPGNVCVFRNLVALGAGWWCPAHLTLWPLQAMPVPSPPRALSITRVILCLQYKISCWLLLQSGDFTKIGLWAWRAGSRRQQLERFLNMAAASEVWQQGNEKVN